MSPGAPGDTEKDYFTYTLSDGTSTDTAQLTITVTGLNDPPTSTPPPTIYAAENQTIKTQTKIFFDDPDPKNNTYGQLSISIVLWVWVIKKDFCLSFNSLVFSSINCRRGRGSWRIVKSCNCNCKLCCIGTCSVTQCVGKIILFCVTRGPW